MIGAAALGILSAYIFATPNATLQVGTLAKVSPVAAASGTVTDQISYFDTAAGIGQDIGEAATGTGTGRRDSELVCKRGLWPWRGPAEHTDRVGARCVTELWRNSVRERYHDRAGHYADDGHWGWFDDMKSSLHNVFAMPETPSS